MGLIDDLIGTLNEANLKGGEADAAVSEAMELLQRAQAVLAESIELTARSLGDSGSGRVAEALGGFQSAQNHVAACIEGLAQGLPKLRHAVEQNTEYIGQISG